MHEVFASLFNDRAIAYRVHQGFEHSAVALSAGVQHMVRSDLGASGVMFTLDTESGFRDVVFITASYGLGETVVQGAVNPDEFYVYKPTLRAGKPADPAPQPRRQGDQDGVRARQARRARAHRRRAASRSRALLAQRRGRHALARQALIIEEHYGSPMDIEWGKDGATGELFILQARPETVQSRARPHASSATRSSSRSQGAGRRPQHRPADRRRPGARRSATCRRWRACSPATCWSPT